MADNLEDLEKQLAILRQKIEDTRKIENSIVKIKNFRILDSQLHFTVFPYRLDVYSIFDEMGIRINDNEGKCDPNYWDALESKLMSLRQIKIEVTTDQRKEFRSYVKPPNVVIKFDTKKNYIIFNNDHKTNIEYIFYKYYNNGAITLNGKYAILTSATDIAIDIIEQLRMTEKTISIEKEVQDLLDRELDYRMRLDKIHEDSGNELPPVVLNGWKLKGFQSQTLEFLKLVNFNGIVGHEMGLGKTPCFFSAVQYYWDNVDSNQKWIVEVPASLRPNWHRQCKKFLNIEPYHLIGSIPSNLTISTLLGTEHKIFIQNYESIAASGETPEKAKIFPWVELFNLVGNLGFGFDEAHYLKNPASARSQACRSIKSKFSIPLSGTPMKNGPKELQPLIQLVNREIAGTYEGWEKAYTYDNGRRAKDPKVLNKILKRVMFRKLHKDVEKDLPPLNRITLEYELSPNARALYLDVQRGFYKDLEKYKKDRSNPDLINSMLAQLMRMKQVASADKVDFVADLAIDIYDSRPEGDEYKKVLIGTQFANSPPIVERIYQRVNDGGAALMFTGNDDPQKRQDIVNTFQNDPSIHYLVCSTKSAMEGLDITAAWDIINVDFMWTPADHQQFEGRGYMRQNDPHGITSRYIVAADTYEEEIAEILIRKMEEIESSVDGVASGTSVATEFLTKLRDRR